MAHHTFNLFVFATVLHVVSTTFFIPYQTPNDCIKLSVGATNSLYFDSTQLKCLPCVSQQTTSKDGLSCVCRQNYRITSVSGNGSVVCEACPQGQVTSLSGWECVACLIKPTGSNGSIDNTCTSCDRNSITVERGLDGNWANQPPSRQCVTCADYTWPSSDGTRCVRCDQVLSAMPSSSKCACVNQQGVRQQFGGVCFGTSADGTSADIVSKTEKLFQVTYGDLVISSSQYFENYTQAAAALCQSKYANVTACQSLANLCSLILYNNGTQAAPTACTMYLRAGSPSPETALLKTDWPANLPWLYYFEKPSNILSDTSITTQFTFPNTVLDLSASAFDLDGSFLGIKPISGGLLQLCKNSNDFVNAAFIFGTVFQQSCMISVRDFWDTNLYPLVFYDIWLKFVDKSGVNRLYAVPVLITNYVDPDGKSVNSGADQSSWQFVRRLFLVDNVGAKELGSATGIQAVRYARSIVIHIQLQSGTADGRIFPPYIEVSYATATLSDYTANKMVQTSFQVSYSMPLSSYERDVIIALAVFLVVAFVFSVVQTWAWSRRAGKVTFDCVNLVKFIVFAAGNVANAFFFVTVGSSIWLLVFYKRQTTVNLLVPDGRSFQFIGFLLAAFFLKLVHLIHLIVCQVSVDIFLIDWERPINRAVSIMAKSPDATRDAQVSIWRTYFVANEWNEIQTTRRISPIFQYFFVVLILSVIGVGNLATMDPSTSLSADQSYHAPMSSVLRFGLISIVYLLLALGQFLFVIFIYERFFEHPIQHFVDFCSLTNISVFVLENYQFGYYIHGRSVHGRADVGLREMQENFVREERDLVTKRGLMPNSDEQTFEISIPLRLRLEYDRIIQPVLVKQFGGAARAAPIRAEANDPSNGGLRILDPATEKSVAAYQKVNELLHMFIDHSLRDIDYITKPRLLVETILGVELTAVTDRGFFCSGVGLSFSELIFFGQEITLIIFEILFFGAIDLFWSNYILDAILTFVLMEIVKKIRDGLGRSNLAKKTLVDKRFLL